MLKPGGGVIWHISEAKICSPMSDWISTSLLVSQFSAHVGGTEILIKDKIIAQYPPPIQFLRNFLRDPAGCGFLVAICWLPCRKFVPPCRAGSLFHCLYLTH